jgi:spore maturation protein CgeB
MQVATHKAGVLAQMSLNIFYIGNSFPGSTSRHRADALSRLGHEVHMADPYKFFEARLNGKVQGFVHYRSGYRLLQSGVEQWVRHLIELALNKAPDIVWIDNGELFGFDAVKLLAQTGAKLVSYNHDDATGKRDGRRFDSMLKSLALYDLCVVVRPENFEEYQQRGARKVVRVWMSYDEVMHAPFKDRSDIPARFQSDVVFIGTWMRGEGRDQFLLDLMNQGIPISIWGDRWQKSALWDQIKACYRGGNLGGRDYVAAIQGAKVCLGMLSKGNRDLHTTRSMEIPYAGGVLCAERTSEHRELYEEGVEAAFWSDAAECARRCRQLLGNDTWRESVRSAGMARVRASRRGHEAMCQKVIDAALQDQPASLPVNPRFLPAQRGLNPPCTSSSSSIRIS